MFSRITAASTTNYPPLSAHDDKQLEMSLFKLNLTEGFKLTAKNQPERKTLDSTRAHRAAAAAAAAAADWLKELSVKLQAADHGDRTLKTLTEAWEAAVCESVRGKDCN